MNRLFTAALAALAMTVNLFSATPASAKDGRVWNPTPADAQIALNEGKVVCYGDKKKKMLSDCMIFNPFKETIVSSTNIRAIAGLQKNQHLASVNAANANGSWKTDEAGNPVTYVSNIAEQQNSASLITQGLAQVPAAFFNGGLAAGINAAFPACGSNCGGGGGSVAYAISGADANAIVQQVTTTNGGGGCPTGTCPATKP